MEGPQDRVYDNAVGWYLTDTGQGIPEQDLPYVFERFYRADTARASDTGGAGLGQAARHAEADAAIAASEGRLAKMREARSDYEIAMPLHEIEAFARAEGYYTGLRPEVRREVLERRERGRRRGRRTWSAAGEARRRGVRHRASRSPAHRARPSAGCHLPRDRKSVV